MCLSRDSKISPVLAFSPLTFAAITPASPCTCPPPRTPFHHFLDLFILWRRILCVRFFHFLQLSFLQELRGSLSGRQAGYHAKIHSIMVASSLYSMFLSMSSFYKNILKIIPPLLTLRSDLANTKGLGYEHQL